MDLARKLLGVYAALAVGLVTFLVVCWVTGLGTDVRTAALVFGACAIGATYGNVRRHRAAKVG